MSATELKKKIIHQRSKVIASNKKAIDDLIDAVGGNKYLAEMLNIPESTVSGWVIRGRISKAGAYLVSEHKMLGEFYKPEDLRLDLANK